MLLAALLDLGVPADAVFAPLQACLPPFRVDVQDTRRRGISCKGLIVEGLEPEPRARGLPAILELIDRADLPERVRDRGRRFFERVGRAEARVHGIPAERIHFHEVGAIDSLVDALGTLLAVEILDPARITCSSLPLGSGTVTLAHGVYPVPAPATLRILEGLPTHPYEVGREVTTPTGAGLAAVLADRFGAPPAGRMVASGYGCGQREAAATEPPNLLRAWLVDPDANPAVDAAEPTREPIVVLETVVDHLAGEDGGHLLERLFEEGALDVFFVATMMKKSRPGLLVTVLARPADADVLEACLIRESGTLGVRRTEGQRRALRRDWREVFLEIDGERYPVRIKCGYLGDDCVSARPEHDDLRRIAAHTGRPLDELRRRLARILPEGGAVL